MNVGKRKGRSSKKSLVQDVMSFFSTLAEGGPATVKDVFHALKLKTHPQKSTCLDIIYDLESDGYLERRDGGYSLANPKSMVEGVLQRRTGGRNYLIPSDNGLPVFVAERNSKGAMNGDKVLVSIFAHKPRTEPAGEVVEILQRARETFVGTLDVRPRYAFLVTQDHTDKDIFIPLNMLRKGKNGDKALVQVTEWPTSHDHNPIGKVVEILGPSGENNTEMHAILAEYGLPYSYPEELETAAYEIPEAIPEEEYTAREDFRSVTTFTIDPRDAKDFDDAISIRPIKKGLWEVGVHIADVSYYVKEGSAIDKEAFKRATSVYLVDRTIPMLPENLCNKLCSLRQGEEKVAYSVIFEITDAAQVKSSRITRTIIKSDRRFTYEEAQAIIEREQQGGEESLPGDAFSKELMALDSLAKILRRQRFEAGALSFDRVEVRFEIDASGRPTSVFFKESKDANKLVEEFMLLANRTVAEYVGKIKGRAPKTFVYRVHPEPDPERLQNFQQFAAKFGYKIKTTGSPLEMAKSMNKLLGNVKGKREQNLMETLSIRSMQKALYTTDNVGHYGLAFEYYTHFTSPIRRYPDLMVHRLLTRYLAGGRTVMQPKYEEKCKHCCSQEQLAEQAERASIKYKQVEYMSERLGQEFPAIISGVTEWGIYAEIVENKCEGLIPMRTLVDDFYEYDDRNYAIIGHATHRRFTLGDSIRIKVVNCNLERKQMDFELVQPSCVRESVPTAPKKVPTTARHYSSKRHR